MKYILLILISITFNNTIIDKQNVAYVKGKGYEGYIFPKEHAIWGFPPNNNRYTPSSEDIKKAEAILKEKIGSKYVKLNQPLYKKPPIDNRTLKKYIRQYVAHLTTDGQIVVSIWLNRGLSRSKESMTEDIIGVQDGGANHWTIDVNLSTKELSNMDVNGIS